MLRVLENTRSGKDAVQGSDRDSVSSRELYERTTAGPAPRHGVVTSMSPFVRKP